MCKYCCCVGGGGSGGGGSPATPQQLPVSNDTSVALPSAATLYSNAQVGEDYLRNRSYSEGVMTNSYHHYNCAYHMGYLARMWEGSGVTYWLDEGVLLINSLINAAQLSSSLSGSQFQDSYMGWASARSDTLGQEVPLFESFFWRHAAYFIYLMPVGDPRRTTLLTFLEVNIFDKWYLRDDHHGGSYDALYRNRTHMASHWACIAMEIELMTANTTRQARCATVRRNIFEGPLPSYGTASLEGQFRPHPTVSGAYTFSSIWNSTTGVSDVAHGNAVVGAVVRARDRGIAPWTDADVLAFSLTARSLVDTMAANVDGTGTDTGWLSDGFIETAFVNRTTLARLAEHDYQRGGQFWAALYAARQRY